MSGIVGIVQDEQRPVDRSLLQALTDALAFRGPDAQAMWSNGEVGFGHTLLTTTPQAGNHRQPASLDGVVWITADLRLDARTDLVAQLGSSGCELPAEATDVELVLHSYRVWGERCVERLRGDFAFAIWDGRARTLFCVRDQIGAKPFFYAQTARGLIFSNTLNCVRMHPDVSQELNRLAIADFLIFGINKEPDTTSFTQVRRLPPAHRLRWHDGKVRVTRYWSLAPDREIRHRRRQEYVEHFLDVLGTAVEDRLQTGRTGIWLSGGLDSSSVAALARERITRAHLPTILQGITSVYDHLIPDRERQYAALVADHLRLPVQYLGADHHGLFEEWEQNPRPEPTAEVTGHAVTAELFRCSAERGRVVLGGHGGDVVQLPSLPYAWAQLRRGQWLPLAADIGQSLELGRMPKVGLRRAWNRWRNRTIPQRYLLPPWLNEDLVREFGLAERVERMNRARSCPHDRRPEAYRSVTSVEMISAFDDFDPGATRCCLEVRQPYFDLRVVEFFLAIPAIPWVDDKALVRVAMRRYLPEVICSRPKTALAGEPDLELLQREDARWIDDLAGADELASFVRPTALPRVWRETDRQRLYMNVRPVCLYYWMRYRNRWLSCFSREVNPHGQRQLYRGAETVHEARAVGLWGCSSNYSGWPRWCHP